MLPLALGALPLELPPSRAAFPPGRLFAQVVVGPWLVNGKFGVARLASSVSVQLRLPLPPWPACTNQSRPQVAVAFFTSFCIEIEPSEQVVWLWKSPETYLPAGAPAPAATAVSDDTPIEIVPMTAMAARATSRFVNCMPMKSAPCCERISIDSTQAI